MAGALEVVHLEGLGERYPKQLSGGQQQRVALCIRPERIMIGESAGGCDTLHRAHIINLIYSGSVRRCIVELPNSVRLKADLDAKATADFRVGDETRIGWFVKDAALLAAETPRFK